MIVARCAFMNFEFRFPLKEVKSLLRKLRILLQLEEVFEVSLGEMKTGEGHKIGNLGFEHFINTGI